MPLDVAAEDVAVTTATELEDWEAARPATARRRPAVYCILTCS